VYNAVQPARKFKAIVETVEVFPHFDEGILKNVGGFIRIS
jgi:hypothetical protein